jgi:hypothetical protein
MDERYPAFRSDRVLASCGSLIEARALVACVANEAEHVANADEPS